MSELSERERIIRRRNRRESAEHWQHIGELIRSGGENHWLDFWENHWPPDKHDCQYIYGKPYSPALVRRIRLGLHYLRISEERQMNRECVFMRRKS